MKLSVKMGNDGRVESISRDYSLTEVKSSIPDYLKPLIYNYKEGETLEKGRKIIPVSGQYWSSLNLNQRAELLELVERLGGDADEYVRSFESMYPNEPRMKK